MTPTLSGDASETDAVLSAPTVPSSPQPAAPSSRRAARAARAMTGVVPVDESVPTTATLEAAPVSLTPVSVTEVEGVDLSASDLPAEDPAAAPTGAHSSRTADDFEAAARLFAFTGEVPIHVAAAEEGARSGDASSDATADTAPAAAADPFGRRRRAGMSFRRVATASFSVGVMGVVALLAVGTTTPAEAVAAATGDAVAATAIARGSTTTDLTAEDEEQIQAYVAPEGVQSMAIERSESYDTETYAELAAESGIINTSDLFHNDPNSDIQWPFAVGVPMSSGFGLRWGRMHEGVDFTPGEGSPIQSVADGVVRVATDSGGAYGVHVIIDHVIDGEMVSTHYAHMQYGSIQVQVGQHVEVGTTIGLTGNTGRSYGAHLHFEVLVGGETPVDPVPWLREHAGG